MGYSNKRKYESYVRTGVAAAQAGYNIYKRAKTAYTGVKRIVNVGREYKSRPAATSTRQTVKKITMPGKNKGNSGPARSGGFLTTGKRKRSDRLRVSKRGVDYTMEVGGATSAADAMYIGHITAPVSVLIECGCRAMFKDLLLKAQFDVSDVTLPVGLTALDTITVLYQLHEGLPLQNASFATAASDSINTLAAWFFSGARPWGLENNSYPDQHVFHSIQLKIGDPAGANSAVAIPVLMMLKHCKVEFVAKSALKIQNRTVSAVGDAEADDVDNVPLSGTGYEGTGTGAIFIKKPASSGSVPTFVGSNNFGLILLKPGVAYGAPDEPPLPQNFDKVTHESKIKIEPGEIKTSVLKWHKKMSFNDFWAVTHPHGAGNTFLTRRKIGNFRFFGIEKMIHFAAADTAIQTVYEHNYDLSSVVSYSRATQSVKFFQAFRDNNL